MTITDSRDDGDDDDGDVDDDDDDNVDDDNDDDYDENCIVQQDRWQQQSEMLMLLVKKYPVCKYYLDCILFVFTFQCLELCHHRQQLL